jgi:hypothetical protein
MNNGKLQYLLDERSDCVHVGFVYSLPELIVLSAIRESKFPAQYTYDNYSFIVGLW